MKLPRESRQGPVLGIYPDELPSVEPKILITVVNIGYSPDLPLGQGPAIHGKHMRGVTSLPSRPSFPLPR